MKTEKQIRGRLKRVKVLRAKYPERYDSPWEREHRMTQRALEWVLKDKTESKGGS